jgi:hypothetical protein
VEQLAEAPDDPGPVLRVERLASVERGPDEMFVCDDSGIGLSRAVERATNVEVPADPARV